MAVFIKNLYWRRQMFLATFQFYTDRKWQHLLKIFTVVIFIVPTVVVSIVIFVLTIPYMIICYIPIINVVYGHILGLLNLLLSLGYTFCNLPEYMEWKEVRENIIDASL